MGLKEYMPIDEIRTLILSNYPYDVYEIIPIKFKDTDKQRAVYRFESSDGPKCLKKVYYDKNNLLFVYSIIEWFYQQGIRVPKLLPTKSGGRFVKYKNDFFIVTEWIEGRRCDYDCDDDIAKAAENLGKMHRLSYGFYPIQGSALRKEDSSWYKTFNRRFVQLLEFNNKAFKSRDKFSMAFLDSFEYFHKRAKHSIEILDSIDEDELIYPVNIHNTICHLDYVNKNLIFTDQGSLYVIDFDKSKIDIPVHDIGTFLKRILKRKATSWDYNVLLLTIENYENERVLSMTELLALFAYLEFPQKYWKISRDYFNDRKDFSRRTYLTMLEKTCSQMYDHDDFCNRFQTYLEKRSNICLDK